MTYEEWKFNDSVTVTTDQDFNINFISNGNSYNKLQTSYHEGKQQTAIGYYQGNDGSMVYDNTLGWSFLNTAYQTIQVDTSSTDYDTFVAWAKNNGGVKMSAGQYQWDDDLGITSPFGTNAIDFYINFNSDNTDYIYILHFNHMAITHILPLNIGTLCMITLLHIMATLKVGIQKYLNGKLL